MKPGERVLSWEEIREIWNTEQISWTARQAIRLLLCSGNRVSEIVQAPWTEFDFDNETWTIPASRYKTKRDLMTPLTPLSIDLLRELKSMYPESGWLFPAFNDCNASAPWASATLAKTTHRRKFTWKPQDLRRTWKTLAGSAGLSIEIRDRIQGHVMPGVSAKHYDKYSYINEKRDALLVWEKSLKSKLDCITR